MTKCRSRSCILRAGHADLHINADGYVWYNRMKDRAQFTPVPVRPGTVLDETSSRTTLVRKVTKGHLTRTEFQKSLWDMPMDELLKIARGEK